MDKKLLQWSVLSRVTKCLSMVAIATFITSCQEERIHEEPQQPTFAVNNNSEELSQRVTMYGKKTSAHKAPSVTRSMMPDALPISRVRFDHGCQL